MPRLDLLNGTPGTADEVTYLQLLAARSRDELLAANG